MIQKNYIIETKHYQNSCYQISDSTLYFKRTHQRSEKQIDIDVFADFWSLAFLPIGNPSIKVLLNNQEITLDPPVCIYIPPHSIMKWSNSAGSLEWHAILSTSPANLIHKNPVQLNCSDLSPKKLLLNSDIDAWLTKAQVLRIVGQNECSNSIAEKVKKWIDETFQEDHLISDFANKMSVSNAYLTKEFKKSFGISPIEYRNKKRVFKAMQVMMTTNARASSVAHSVGFNDYSRFTKNFHHFLNATPREFKQKDLDINL